MKKILLAAVAAVAIVGCAQNEEMDNLGNKAEVNFKTVVSKSTRAAVTDKSALEKSGFTVYGYATGEKEMATAAVNEMKSFMSDIKATYNTGWELSGGPHYWPITGNVQFFAYGNPGVGALVYNEPTGSQVYPTITYTVADVADQTDLVVAKAINQTKTAAAGNGVNLAFTHALTQINFSVKGADNYTYKVSSITLKGIANKGTYDFGATENEWGSLEGDASYIYTLKTDNSVTGTTPYAIGADNSALMLMPQAMPTADNKASIEVIYQVFNGDVPTSEIITSAIDLKGTTDWGAGKKIRYTLELANQGATVSFVPEVGDWTTDSNKEVNNELPKNN